MSAGGDAEVAQGVSERGGGAVYPGVREKDGEGVADTGWGVLAAIRVPASARGVVAEVRRGRAQEGQVVGFLVYRRGKTASAEKEVEQRWDV